MQRCMVIRKHMNAENVLHANYNPGKIFFTLLFSLSLTLSLISFVWNVDVFIKVNTLLGVFALMILAIKLRRAHLPVYAYMGLLAGSFLLSSLIVGRTGWRLFTPILFILSGFGFAMILLRGYVYSWGGYLVFYGLAGYFLVLMLTGVPGSEALKYCSYNGISQIILVASISLYTILDAEKKKIDLIPAVITVIISIWGIGRSGIIASFMLLAGLLFVKLKKKPKYIYRLIAGTAVVFLIMFATNFSFFSNAVSHYSERGATWTDEARTTMWKNYFHNLDVSRIVGGVNVVTAPWSEGERNAYNYHNSFISLHAQTGILGLITLALIGFSLVKFYRTNLVLFILMSTLLLRASVDQLIFFGRFDFLPFYFIFYTLSSTKTSFKGGSA